MTKVFGHGRGIRDISLDVTGGQVFGFLGPNGAGKSTTIRVMMGLYPATEGRVEIFGEDVGRRGPRLRARIGYLPGELALYPRLTGREILDRFARLRGGVRPSRREELQARLAVELDRPVHALSKGNRQKIGLVQAFMHDPELLVLDEPTSGLDPLLQKVFADLLQDVVRRGSTVFLSSHDLDEVQQLAHEVAIIREGRIVAADTVEALRRRAPRTVTLTFRRPVDTGELAGVDGVTVTGSSGSRVSFAVQGEVGPLLERAVPLGVRDVSARSADLDELFLDFYAAGAEGEPHGG